MECGLWHITLAVKAGRKVQMVAKKDPFPLGRLISGGQTGVDQWALETALLIEISIGGWCPLGRRSEDGPIPSRFSLREASTILYPQRTRMNIRDSDATVIFFLDQPCGGTLLTLNEAVRQKRPHLLIPHSLLASEEADLKLLLWLWEIQPGVLNVAGPRESEAGMLEPLVRSCLKKNLRAKSDSRRIPDWPPSRPVTKGFPNLNPESGL